MSSVVSIVRCENYDPDRVSRAVHRALEPLGGIGRFVKQGDQVLLKPNMLSAKVPERGVTTHPAVLEAMVEEVRAAGGEVAIGDSPSGTIKGIQQTWEKTGFLALSKKKNVALRNFESEGTVLKEIGKRSIYLARSILEADVVINLPKFKTHGFTLYTGAIKNLYGSIPGYQKAVLHKLYPHPENFSGILVDLYRCIKTRLHLMDGIIGMEGNGPATGNVRESGLILASDDGVALDAVASSVMGFREGSIDAIRIAGEQGLGEHRLERIRISGESLEKVRFTDYDLPSNYLIKLVPQRLIRWAGRFIWVKPTVNRTECTSCGICAANCPVGAIRMENGQPVLYHQLCIQCLCCNESCPEGAIVPTRSPLTRFLG